MEREKERELELEAAMYTNCLLLGLDPIIIGLNTTSTTTTTTPRVGLFRHSNPKLGEQLLYFLLSSLRGPIQSAKDFDKVWPIFDSAQSRDFRKVVQSIINELESQGALPRSNSRVSSLATCCGPRFIELLWQLSLHALREVHRRTFVSDVASSPLPAPLTDVAFSHAATLLPVTKARIALERRRFLKNAEMAVNRQAMWSNLAHEMTAEFRGLCAEEAYLQQELEKLQDLRNKAKLDGELWDDRVSSSSSQNSHLISKATRLWESLLARKGQHEVLASGPIEDLINHREHRYRISGSSLLAAMDQTSQVPYGDVLSVQPGDMDSALANDKEVMDSSSANVNRQKNYLDLARVQNDDTLSRAEERSGRAHPTVDIAEILRRWTHALQRIHKQSLHMAKANGGEGPELLQSAHDGGANGHAVTLASTLTEHKQHLASIQVLVDQLKEAAPALQKSISELTEEANSISSTLPPLTKFHGRSTSPFQAQSSSRTMESSLDDVSEVTSKLSSVKLQKASSSPPTLKLPQLFSLTPNSSAKNAAKRHTFSQTSQIDNGSEGKQPEQPQPSSSHVDNPSQDGSSSHVQNLKRSVREAALSVQSCNIESSHDNQSDDGSEHFFVPLSVTGFSRTGGETKSTPMRSKQQFSSPSKTRSLRIPNSHRHAVGKFDDKQNVSTDSTPFHETDSHVNGYASCIGPKYPVFDSHKSLYDAEESQDQVFSPPLLMDTSLLNDPFEDLLAPLSEIDAALMEH